MSTTATMRPLPRAGGPEQTFWDGLRAGEVRVQRCVCGHCRFPASRNCPVCHSAGFSWTAVEPEGVVESFCVFHKQYFPAIEVPYAVVQVRLRCGVRMFSNLLHIPIDQISIGIPVTAVFENAADGTTLLKFRPTERAA
jgi:uncharacterized OB-fold protein